MANTTINENTCKGCGLCVTVCPKKIIMISEDRLNAKGYFPARITNMDECIACAMCAMICPDCAIKVER